MKRITVTLSKTDEDQLTWLTDRYGMRPTECVRYALNILGEFGQTDILELRDRLAKQRQFAAVSGRKP